VTPGAYDEALGATPKDGTMSEIEPSMTRREFVRNAVVASAAVAIGGHNLLGEPGASSGPAGGLEPRPYGKTGIRLSVIGFGGVVVMKTEQDHANQVVAKAVERGEMYDLRHDGAEQETQKLKALAATLQPIFPADM